MVQTRSASGIDVPPPPTPSRPRSSAGPPGTVRRSRRKVSSPDPDSLSPSQAGEPVSSSVSAPSSTAASSPRPSSSPPSSSAFAHTPTPTALVWLTVSLPLVIWDTGYVLGRPHTMPGGAYHWPLWQPYALYGEVDHVYGFKQWRAGNGFTGAQGSLNVVETLIYGAYLFLWARYGQLPSGSSSSNSGSGPLFLQKSVGGRVGASALLLLFTASVMTLSKTVLYWLNEYFSGFDNIGHNDLQSLLFLWIIPNGLWIVFPAILSYSSGSEIVRAVAGQSETPVKDE